MFSTAAPPGPPLSETARRVLAEARDEAERLGHGTVEPEHIFWSIARENDGLAAVIIGRLTTDRAALDRAVTDLLSSVPQGHIPNAVDLEYSSRSQLVLRLAGQEARDSRDGRLRTHHLLLGVLRERNATRSMIDGVGLSLHNVRAEQDRLLG
jgi:ATP-dependent Clp protease ATP-binding subunit ClpC